MQMFQVLPSVVRVINDEFEMDVDFCDALRIYLNHFESICVACPVAIDTKDAGLDQCVRLKDLPWNERRFKFIPLPRAYSPFKFLRNLSTVRKILRDEISAAEYLVFSPHTLVGDWSTIAACEAMRLKRSYLIEADVVYENVMQIATNRSPLWKRVIKRNFHIPLFQQSYRYLLKHCDLGLFQGGAVYDAYAPYCKNPHKMYYHIPIYKDDHISDEQLQLKLDNISAGKTLKVCYAGRAVDMKGPIDWVDTLDELILRGVDLQATWLGTGSLLQTLQRKVIEMGTESRISFPGFTSDRKDVLRLMLDCHIFLYCHKTLESSRVLGEALACGCPIIGYESSYSSDLVSKSGGGCFVNRGSWMQLADCVQRLDRNREALKELVVKAAASGRSYDREEAMLARINLIKSYVLPPARTSLG